VNVLEHRTAVGRAVPWLALVACSFAVLLATGTVGTPAAYALVRDRVQAGELFRLWTGHFVHFNSAHLVGDLLAFGVWAALVEGESRRLLAFTLLAGTPLLSLALLATCPDLSEYRGLSALDCALVSELLLARGLALELSKHSRAPTRVLAAALGTPAIRAIALLAAVAFLAKCVFELRAGHALLAPDLGPGVKLLPLAHLLGILLGALAVRCEWAMFRIAR
jgi:hypothetical protein